MALSIFSLMGSIFVDSSEAEKSISQTEEKSNKLSESFINGIANAGKWAGGIALAAGSAAVAIGSAAVNISTDVDSAMNSFYASTGTAVDELGEYEDAMISIYKNNFGESFEDISKSMSEIKQIMGEGMGAEELEAMTTNALMLRDTFDFEVNESVRAANSLMDQFGITGEEAYNLIAQGAQNGLNQNGDLLDVLNEYSSQFSQAGYGAEDMFNMLANGAKSGTWSVDKLGDSVKEFNIRMKDGTSTEALKKLGLNVDSVNAKYVEGGEAAQEATQEIIEALQGVEDENERYLLGQELMGTMWEDLGEDAVYALLDTQGEISNTKDALSEINEVKYDDIGSMVEGLKRNFETLLLPIGNALIPLILTFVGLIQDNMPLVESILADLTPVIISVFESLIPPLMELISNVLPVVTDLINKLLPPILEIVDMILPLIFQLLTPILDLMPQILALLDPIIEACINLITPIAELLEKYLPPLIEIFTFIANVVLFGLQTAFQSMSAIITNVVNVAVSYIDEQITILKDIFNEIVSFITNVFSGDWEEAFENLKSILGNVFDGMVNVVKTPINLIIGVINGLISGVTSGINTVIRALNSLSIDVPKWVTKEFGIKSLGFNIKEISAPQIPLLAEGGNIMEEGKAITGENGAELLDLPQGARVTPLTQNGDPIGYKALASKLDTMIMLLNAILEKEGVVRIGEKEFVSYVNRSLGALI